MVKLNNACPPCR